MKMFHLCVECEVASQEIPFSPAHRSCDQARANQREANQDYNWLVMAEVMWPGAGQSERGKPRLQIIGHGRGHVTRRGPIRAIQHCKWLHSSHSTLQAVIRPHQISMFQSLHSGIQDSNEYNKDPLTNESELFQSPSIKADQKSSKTSVSWELSRNSLWSRVLLPTPNTLSGIAQVWR